MSTYKNVIEITIQLSCDDKGLDKEKVAAGYLLNIEKMHNEEYIKVDKKGKVTERVKMISAIASPSKYITYY